MKLPHTLRGIDALRAGGLVDRERVVAQCPAVRVLADIGHLGLSRATAVADDYRAVAFEAFIPIEGLCILFERSARARKKPGREVHSF